MGQKSQVAGELRVKNSVEKNLWRVELSHGIQQDHQEVYEKIKYLRGENLNYRAVAKEIFKPP